MSTTIHSADPETLTNVKNDAKKKAEDQVKDTAEKARGYVADKTDAAEQAMKTATAEAQDGLTKASSAARDFAVKQPLATAAGALAIGVLVGLAISNRR